MSIGIGVLKRLVAEIKSERLPDNQSLVDLPEDEINLDSLEITNLILRLEDEYECVVDLESLSLEDFVSISSLMRLIKHSTTTS